MRTPADKDATFGRCSQKTKVAHLKSRIALALSFACSLASAEIIKRVDTLSHNQGINFTTGVKYTNINVDQKDFNHRNYSCTDTVPPIDLFLDDTYATDGHCSGGLVYAVGSPRIFYIPSLITYNQFPRLNSEYSDGILIDLEQKWFSIDSIRTDSCILPCFLWESWTYDDTADFLVQTKSGKYVLVQLVPVTQTDTCYILSFPEEYTYFREVIITSYLQTDGTSNFLGIPTMINPSKNHRYSAQSSAKRSDLRIFDLCGRLILKSPIHNSRHRGVSIRAGKGNLDYQIIGN